MTARYYVTPYDPALWRDEEPTTPRPQSDLVISFKTFLENARERWSKVHAALPHSWQIPTNTAFGVTGSFLGEGNQILAIEPDDDENGFVDFLLWYRSFVPLNYSLYLFREGHWDSLRLTDTTTPNDIIAFCGWP